MNNRIGMTLRFNRDELKAIEAATFIKGGRDPKKLAKALVLNGTGIILKQEMERRQKEQTDGATVQPITEGSSEVQQLQTTDSGTQK